MLLFRLLLGIQKALILSTSSAIKSGGWSPSPLLSFLVGLAIPCCDQYASYTKQKQRLFLVFVIVVFSSIFQFCARKH